MLRKSLAMWRLEMRFNWVSEELFCPTSEEAMQHILVNVYHFDFLVTVSDLANFSNCALEIFD